MNEQNQDRKYNGWTNYETWAVSLWIGNEEGTACYWKEQARQWRSRANPAIGLSEQLKEEITEGAPELGCTLYGDLMSAALSEVDWYEIAEHYFEDSGDELTDEGESCEADTMSSPAPQERREALPHREPALSGSDNPFGEILSRYTRAQAIDDGTLVDVTDTAKEAGFRFPVALTRAVFAEYVQVPEGVEAQDESGRLWDVLFMCSVAVRKAKDRNEVVYCPCDGSKTLAFRRRL